MLRRFMNWLLHQLQKLLGAIGKRRINARPSPPLQDDLDTKPSPELSSIPTETSTLETSKLSESSVSFSLRSPALQPSDSQKDAIQLAVDNADEVFDTYMRLDAASSTVSGSDNMLSNSEPTAGGRQPPTQSAADDQPAAQLPSIHDLLPAVEQEIKANSANRAEETSLIEPKSTSSKSSDGILSEPKQIEAPEQVLLFSFEITESEIVKSVNDKTDLAADNSDELLAEPTVAAVDSDADAIAQFMQSTADSDSEPEARSPDEPAYTPAESTPLGSASLPYPWSIATPNTAHTSEDKADSQPEEIDRMPSPTERNPEQNAKQIDPASRDVTQTHSSAPIASSPSQPTDYPVKNGVVKLLFTMKEGNFHGYIEPEDGTSDILFHQKYINEDIFDSLERGVEVVASVKYVEGKAYAMQVELAE